MNLAFRLYMAPDDSKAYAFTGYFPVYRGRIVSDIMLCSPDEGNPNSIRVRAMWDTGCSQTVISQQVADFLSLRTTGTRVFRSPLGGRKLSNLTNAKLCVVLGAARVKLEVGIVEKPNSDLDCDVTLGLDFITMGDFAFTHHQSQLVLSFCYPPVGYPTDFTLIAPKFLTEAVDVECCEINESEAVECRRRGLIMLDYYAEAAKVMNNEGE